MELQTLLKEWRQGEAKPFYVANEAKNILIELHDTRSLEQELFRFTASMSEDEKRALLPILGTTTHAMLNRLVLLEYGTLLTNETRSYIQTRLKDIHTSVPQETVEQLVAFGVRLDVEVALDLIDAQKWEMLVRLTPLWRVLEAQEREGLTQALEGLDPTLFERHIHGVTITLFDKSAWIDSLNA